MTHPGIIAGLESLIADRKSFLHGDGDGTDDIFRHDIQVLEAAKEAEQENRRLEQQLVAAQEMIIGLLDDADECPKDCGGRKWCIGRDGRERVTRCASALRVYWRKKANLKLAAGGDGK
ncbi:MAG: hypothetical protein ABFC57_08700 [Veillonellales bacterium]